MLRIFLFIVTISWFCACKEPITPEVKGTPVSNTGTKSSVTNNAKGIQKAPAEVLKAQSSTVVTAEVAGQPTVAFPFDVDLKDADGQLHKSKEVFKLNGKPTVLMFWLSTCSPCHMKLNAIKPLYSQWAEEADFNIYAISGDYTKNFAKFSKQTKSKNWEWDTFNDVNRSFKAILPGGLNGYPQTFIFDAKGQLVYQDKRYRSGDEHRLFKKIKQVCKG